MLGIEIVIIGILAGLFTCTVVSFYKWFLKNFKL
jgi:hypothetical protein